MQKVIDRFSAIKAENKELVSGMIQKAVKNGDTVYGELSDWIRDYHSDLSLLEREVLCQMLLGDMVIHHPERICYDKVRVLCYCDTTDNTKGVLLVTKAGGNPWDNRQAIDNAIRCAFYDQYAAEGVHPADEDKEVFEQVLDKLAAGQDADLYEYEIFWDNTVMV